jgi:hypothetical protein
VSPDGPATEALPAADADTGARPVVSLPRPGRIAR